MSSISCLWANSPISFQILDFGRRCLQLKVVRLQIWQARKTWHAPSFNEAIYIMKKRYGLQRQFWFPVGPLYSGISVLRLTVFVSCDWAAMCDIICIPSWYGLFKSDALMRSLALQNQSWATDNKWTLNHLQNKINNKGALKALSNAGKLRWLTPIDHWFGPSICNSWLSLPQLHYPSCLKMHALAFQSSPSSLRHEAMEMLCCSDEKMHALVCADHRYQRMVNTLLSYSVVYSKETTWVPISSGTAYREFKVSFVCNGRWKPISRLEC